MTSPAATVSGLAWGSHAILVEALDPIGNVSPRTGYTLTSSWLQEGSAKRAMPQARSTWSSVPA